MIRWSAAARKKARAGRRDEAPRSSRKALDLAAARRAIAATFAKNAQRWADGQSEADPTRARLMEAVRLSLSSDAWTPAGADVEGARAAMVTDWQSAHAGDDALSDWLVPLWATSKGVKFALEALMEAAGLRMRWHVQVEKEAGWYLVHQPPEYGPKQRSLRGWGALRDELGRAPWPDYRDALEHAAPIRSSASLALRCALTYAFPTERPWAVEDAAACFASAEFPEYAATLLAVEEIDLCIRVARSCPPWALAEEHLYTLVDAVGEAAVHPLEVLLERCDPEGSTSRSSVARALTLIETDAAASVLARRLAEPKIRRLLEKYFAQVPDLAVQAFAREFAAPGAPGRAAAATVYAGLLAERGSVVAGAVAPLTEAERRTLDQLEGMARSEAAAKASPERVALREAWSLVEKWLHKNHPAKTEMLAPAATIDETDVLERGLGFPLSEDLRASLLEHNGESDEAVGLLEGFELLSTERILDEWKMTTDATSSWSENENEPVDPVEGVRLRHWHPRWIPIAADGAGNLFCVDVDPAEGGEIGQVIFRDHEVGPQYVVAPSMKRWLTRLAEHLKNGDAHVWSDGSVHEEPEE